MAEFQIIDPDQPYTQDAWAEELDNQGKVLVPARQARDEHVVAVRVDRQFTARFRIPRTTATGPGRQNAIANARQRAALGQEVTPGVQVVEYEFNLEPAGKALVIPNQGFIPATTERVEHHFTLRVNGLHLTKASLTQQEFTKPNWRNILISKVKAPEIFEV